MNNVSILAIIPARCGSKGVRDKNIKTLNGEPLIAYTIKAAIKADVFDCIMVSTDSRQYADIAVNYGAEVPFLRDSILANDTANTWDVVKDVIHKFELIGIGFDYVSVLQPTSPLRDSSDIVHAIDIMKEKKAKLIVSVCEEDHSPLWVNTLTDDGSMDNFYINMKNIAPRQLLKKYYRINGAVYLIEVKHLLECQDIYSTKCYPLIMTKEHSIDIDDDWDFQMAEWVMMNLNI